MAPCMYHVCARMCINHIDHFLFASDSWLTSMRSTRIHFKIGSACVCTCACVSCIDFLLLIHDWHQCAALEAERKAAQEKIFNEERQTLQLAFTKGVWNTSYFLVLLFFFSLFSYFCCFCCFCLCLCSPFFFTSSCFFCFFLFLYLIFLLNQNKHSRFCARRA